MKVNFFCDRLRFLRNERKLSAREMSLALGQNETYINKVETGQRAVSMDVFFKICNFLQITPSAFFDESIKNTKNEEENIVSTFRKLTPKQSEYILGIIQELCK